MTALIESEIVPTAALPTVIHVDDDLGWRDTVRLAVTKSGIPLRQFTASDSMEPAVKAMESTSGPLIVIIDLRFERGKEIFYEGYEWLLTSLPSFLANHASLCVMVVSAQLHEGIISTLRGRGVPDNWIFGKGGWFRGGEGDFVAQLRHFVEHVDDYALGRLTRGVSGSKMDPHLLHAIAATGPGSDAQPETFPLLVQVRNEELWDTSAIRGLEIIDNIGTIFAVNGTMESVPDLERDTNVLRVEYSRSVGGYDCDRSVPYVKANTARSYFSNEGGDKCLIGLIDSGIDILSPAFLDSDGHSRIIAIWDQNDSTGPRPPKGRGTLHSAFQIQQYVTTKSLPAQLASYDSAHGTHVASIAAGRAWGSFAGGVAPAAKLALVIPSFEVPKGHPRSLGYSQSHMLGIKFLAAEAKRQSLPLVINISMGANAGAHDGTALLEKACDELTGRAPGIIIVKSAGNERNRKNHAIVNMTNHGREVVRWDSLAWPRHEDSMEAWFQADDQIRFRICDPFGRTSRWVGVNASKKGTSVLEDDGLLSGDVRYDMTFSDRVVDNGDSRCVITLTSKSGQVSSGTWRLEIESDEVRNGQIHIWLERYEKRMVEFKDHIREETTLSIPGTAHWIVAVGSVSASMPLELGEYSSCGPTRDGRHKPELAAPGHEVNAAAVSPEQVVAMSGTSQAAPHVAGTIALLCSLRAKKNGELYNAAQIQKALTQLVQHAPSTWHGGIGHGVLDADRFLRAMV